MKKLVYALALSLALGCGSMSAKGHGHGHGCGRPEPPRHHGAAPAHRPAPAPCMVGNRPSAGVFVSLGGIQLWYSDGFYYRPAACGRYERALPPIGMMVDRLYGAQTFFDRGQQYFVSQGVIYAAARTPRGIMYQVVKYL